MVPLVSPGRGLDFTVGKSSGLIGNNAEVLVKKEGEQDSHTQFGVEKGLRELMVGVCPTTLAVWLDLSMHCSVVLVSNLRSRSPTIFHGKVVEGCQHSNVHDFVQPWGPLSIHTRIATTPVSTLLAMTRWNYPHVFNLCETSAWPMHVFHFWAESQCHSAGGCFLSISSNLLRIDSPICLHYATELNLWVVEELFPMITQHSVWRPQSWRTAVGRWKYGACYALRLELHAKMPWMRAWL